LEPLGETFCIGCGFSVPVVISNRKIQNVPNFGSLARHRGV